MTQNEEFNNHSCTSRQDQNQSTVTLNQQDVTPIEDIFTPQHNVTRSENTLTHRIIYSFWNKGRVDRRCSNEIAEKLKKDLISSRPAPNSKCCITILNHQNSSKFSYRDRLSPKTIKDFYDFLEEKQIIETSFILSTLIIPNEEEFEFEYNVKYLVGKNDNCIESGWISNDRSKKLYEDLNKFCKNYDNSDSICFYDKNDDLVRSIDHLPTNAGTKFKSYLKELQIEKYPKFKKSILVKGSTHISTQALSRNPISPNEYMYRTIYAAGSNEKEKEVWCNQITAENLREKSKEHFQIQSSQVSIEIFRPDDTKFAEMTKLSSKTANEFRNLLEDEDQFHDNPSFDYSSAQLPSINPLLSLDNPLVSIAPISELFAEDVLSRMSTSQSSQEPTRLASQ